MVLDGEIRVEAAKALGLAAVPCIRIDHLTEVEQRTLRLALNRLSEKGQWDLGELKIEFEELILTEAPIEISGFALEQIDQIILGDEVEEVEPGSACSRTRRCPVRAPRRYISPRRASHSVRRRYRPGGPGSLDGWGSFCPARSDHEPYNVPIARNVTGGAHREFLMGSGEMSEAEFLPFNSDWMSAALPFLCDGGVFGTFIDWRGYPRVFAAASKLALNPVNLIV